MSDLWTGPGIYPDLDEAAYHADIVPETSLSNSGAKLLLDCPARFDHARRHPRSSKTFEFGRAAHAKVLGVGSPVVTVPEDLCASNGAWSTKDAKAFIAEQTAAGSTVLKPAEIAVVDAMAERLAAHPVASALLRDGEAETSLFARDADTNVMLRARLDWRTKTRNGRPVIVDYKTAESADPDRFGHAAASYGYHGQDPWYRDLADELFDETHAFVFIVQEKAAPYLVSVCELDDVARRAGAARNKRARRLYAECMTSGEWPGYAPIVHPISVPAWAREVDPTTESEIPA